MSKRNPVAKNVNAVHKPSVIPKQTDGGPKVCMDCLGHGWNEHPFSDMITVCKTCGGEGYV